MKKLTCLLLALAFAFTVVGPALAGDLPRPVDKLTKGAVEVIKSPTEFYSHTMGEMDSAEHKPLGLIKGLLESPFHVVKKAGAGVIDIATFPVE